MSKQRWFVTHSRHRRGVILAMAFHWHDGRNKGIRGFDLSIGYGIASLHINYRTPTPPTGAP